MRPFWRIVIAVMVLPLFAQPSWSLGLGEITMFSYLNEPLRAEVSLLDAQDMRPEDIKIRMATQDDFDRLGVDRAYFLTSIQFHVVIDGSDSKVVLRSEQPLVEPYLDFLLETRWPQGRLLRGYTVLVDLPRRISAPAAVQSAREIAGSSQPTSGDVAPPATNQTLPVAQTPTRNYDEAAEERPRAGGQYLVQTDDTLWEIALAAKPANVTMEQTMVATVAMNGDAFTGNNINGLKAGYVLELPSEREILLSAPEAQTEVARQNADWAAGIRRTRSVRVVAEDDLEAVDDTPNNAPASADDGLATASSAIDGSQQGAAAAMEVSSENRDPAPSTRSSGSTAELTAIEARLTALSTQMGELRELVAVKDQQIAALQAELAARDAAQANRAVAETSVPASEQAMTGLPWWLWVLGGVVVVSIGGVVFARWSNTKSYRDRGEPLTDAFDALDPEPIKPQPPIDKVAGGAASKDSARNTQRASDDNDREVVNPTVVARAEDGPGSTSSETVASNNAATDVSKPVGEATAVDSAVADAIAEADIYLAYGRYQQALDVLESVAKTEPNSAAPLIKMIEIYLDNDRIAEAQALLPAVESTHDVAAIKQAQSLLDAAVPAVDIGDLTGEIADSMAGQIDADPTAQGTDNAETTLGLDAAPEPLALDTFEGDLQQQYAPEQGPLELDLDLAELTPQAVEETTTAPVEEPEAKFGAADWGDAGDENVAGFQPDKLPPALASVLGSEIPPPFEETADEEESGLIYSVETDPIDTKLDLARAYIDMGDEDGARPVLDDVINSGDLQQQAQARELLLRIDLGCVSDRRSPPEPPRLGAGYSRSFAH